MQIIMPAFCTKEEMILIQKNILAGKNNEGFRSVNQVDDVPKAFKEWVHNNQERIVRAKALPYFLRDNGKVVDGKWVYRKPTADAVGTVTNGYQGSAPSIVQDAKIKYENAMERYGDLDVRYNNELNLENVVQVDGMAHREADSMNVNPQWGAEGGKRNCQASVAVYALRREGYMVRAAINDGSELFEKAEKSPEILWIDKKTGNKPILKKAGGKYVGEDRSMKVKSRSEMMSEFNEHTKEEGLYQIMFDWDRLSNGYGHTIAVERLKDGSLMVFDPQRGAHYKWRDYVRKISSNSGIDILPLKELAFNPEYASILKKSNS